VVFTHLPQQISAGLIESRLKIHMNAPLPPSEPSRLEALREYRLLDTKPETAFDDITTLAAHICDVPIALMVEVP